jgi:Protein of unknown function (DUF3016)
MRQLVIAGVLSLILGPAAASDRVQVVFADTEKFADFGRSGWDREHNQKQLTALLEQALAGLPQPVKVTVLDVNLAGELEWLRRSAQELRVLRSVTWPTIEFEYQLQGQEPQKARISDMGYLDDSFFTAAQSRDGLRYERRMIDRWVRDTFGKSAVQK